MTVGYAPHTPGPPSTMGNPPVNCPKPSIHHRPLSPGLSLMRKQPDPKGPVRTLTRKIRVQGSGCAKPAISAQNTWGRMPTTVTGRRLNINHRRLAANRSAVCSGLSAVSNQRPAVRVRVRVTMPDFPEVKEKALSLKETRAVDCEPPSSIQHQPQSTHHQWPLVHRQSRRSSRANGGGTTQDLPGSTGGDGTSIRKSASRWCSWRPPASPAKSPNCSTAPARGRSRKTPG